MRNIKGFCLLAGLTVALAGCGNSTGARSLYEQLPLTVENEDCRYILARS